MADLGQGSRPDDGASPSRGGLAGRQARQDIGGGIADSLRPQRLDGMLRSIFPRAAANAAPGQRIGRLVGSTADRSAAQAESPDQSNPVQMDSAAEQRRGGTQTATTPARGVRRAAAPSERAAGRRLGNLVGNIHGYLQPRHALDAFRSPTTRAAADAALARRQGHAPRIASPWGAVRTGPNPRSSPRGSRGSGGRRGTPTTSGSPCGGRRAAAPNPRGQLAARALYDSGSGWPAC
jgi:hypothetical protein